jgi:MarR family transcriptional regulator, organic hydroperoxide resistance regulator
VPVSDAPFAGSLGWALARTAMAHRARAAELLGECGLHPGQEFLLETLWAEDGMRITALAERLRVEPPTATKMVSRLEAAGTVRRAPDPVDGRAIRVWLTDAGRDLRSRVHEAWRQLEDESTAGLSARQTAELRRLLDRVRAGLDAGPDARC